MITLTKEQIIMLHEAIYERYGGSCGVLNEGMLELNGWHVNATNEEFADIIMGIAASEKDDEDLENWVEAHT